MVRASAVLLSTACAGPPAAAAYCDVRQIIEVGVAVHLAQPWPGSTLPLVMVRAGREFPPILAAGPPSLRCHRTLT